MRAFSVIGITKTGKTTTIENIIRELKKRNYSVGSIKEIHFDSFAIDIPGTNTDRHRQAGSELVTARGYHETDIMFPSKLPIEEILRYYEQDYVVMEGVKDYNIPMIPGTDKAITDIEKAKNIAVDIGYPILIKAAAGGGGKGMRAVFKPEDFEEQMKMAVNEATSAFGNGSVFIEKFVGC